MPLLNRVSFFLFNLATVIDILKGHRDEKFCFFPSIFYVIDLITLIMKNFYLLR